MSKKIKPIFEVGSVIRNKTHNPEKLIFYANKVVISVGPLKYTLGWENVPRVVGYYTIKEVNDGYEYDKLWLFNKEMKEIINSPPSEKDTHD